MILGCRAHVGKNIFLINRQRLGKITRFLIGWVGWSKIHDGLKKIMKWWGIRVNRVSQKNHRSRITESHKLVVISQEMLRTSRYALQMLQKLPACQRLAVI